MAKPINEMTPMQRQYHAIKERNQGSILVEHFIKVAQPEE